MQPSPTPEASNNPPNDSYETAGAPNVSTDAPVTGQPPQPTHQQSATSLTSKASIAAPGHDPWLMRFAEPRTASIRWWTLIVGVVGTGLGVWASFAYLITNALWFNIILGLATWAALLIGVSCLARFVLDVIVTQRAGRNVRQRLTEHVV